MNKAKTGKLLSAAALANMAVAGFAAAPAGAAAHPAGGAAAKAAATVTQSRGFVPIPKAAAHVRPNTETGCNSYICVGLYGGGNFVSYFNAHWYNGTGCHRGFLGWRTPHSSSFFPFSNVCYKQQVQVNFHETFVTGTQFCARFSGIDNSLSLCEPVR